MAVRRWMIGDLALGGAFAVPAAPATGQRPRPAAFTAPLAAARAPAP